MENFSISRFGDIFSWYYGNTFETNSNDISLEPKTNEEIKKEINELDKNVLKDLRF